VRYLQCKENLKRNRKTNTHCKYVDEDVESKKGQAPHADKERMPEKKTNIKRDPQK